MLDAASGDTIEWITVSVAVTFVVIVLVVASRASDWRPRRSSHGSPAANSRNKLISGKAEKGGSGLVAPVAKKPR
jgi:hypothetical protein